MTRIDFVSVTMTYGKKNPVTALRDFSASFSSGKIHVILGPSGSGKTTILRCVLGLDSPEKGTILFDKEDANLFPTTERNFAYVSQRPNLYPHFSVYENIALPLRRTLADADELRYRVNQVAEMVGIQECLSRKPKDISLGQAERVMIAKAMIKKPNAYLFDEPCASLDPRRAEEIQYLLLRLFQENHPTVLYVTHSLQEAYRMADDYTYIENGTCLAQGELVSMQKNSDLRVREIFRHDDLLL